eukprot:UC4_evm2s173
MGGRMSYVDSGTDTRKEEMGKIIGVFDAKYIGSVIVKQATGNDICSDAVDRIKTMSIPERKVRIVVSEIGLYVIDYFSNGTLKETQLEDVSFVTLDKQDKKIFSYLTASHLDPIIYCHTFTVKSRSHDIPVAINTAFKVSRGEIANPETFDDFRMTKKEALIASQLERPPEEIIKDISENNVGNIATQILAKYKGKYIGEIPVAKAEGKDIIASAEQEIRANEYTKPIKVIIELSSLGLDIKKNEKEVTKHIPISEISFMAIDDEDDRHFSLITHDKIHGLMDCHIFELDNHADKLSILIGQAYKAAEMVRNKVRSPSAQALSVMKTRREEQLLFDPSQRDDVVVEHPTGEILGVFNAKFLGMAPVSVSRGEKANADVQHALALVSNAPELSNDKVQIIVSSEGIKILDTSTKYVTANVFIKNITFTTVTGKLKTIFAFIAKNTFLKNLTCYLLATGSKSQDVCAKIGEAFDVAVKEMKARSGNMDDNSTFVRGGNAFQPIKSVKDEIVGPLKDRIIPRGNLRPKNCIGAGRFGLIYISTLTIFKKKEGVSDRKDILESEATEWGDVEVHMLRGGSSVDVKMDFVHHAEILSQLTSPQIQSLFGVILQQRPWMIAVEHCQYGPMKDILTAWFEKNNDTRFSNPIHPAEMFDLLYQVAQGLMYMHNKQFIHMGLTCSQILLANNNKIKLTGLDFAHELPKGQENLKMTLSTNLPTKWLSIESLQDKTFSFKTDIWTFGVVFWEFFSYGAEPLGPISNKDVLANLLKGVRYRIPDNCPEEVYKIFYQCWDKNPKNRPSLNYLCTVLQAGEREFGKPSTRDIGASGISAVTGNDKRNILPNFRREEHPKIAVSGVYTYINECTSVYEECIHL